MGKAASVPAELSGALASVSERVGALSCRVIPDGGDGHHRASCVVCRKLKPDELARVELAFVSWSSSLDELHQAHAIGKGRNGRERFELAELAAHCAFYQLDLVRVGRLASAYGELVAAGISSAKAGKATPQTALDALSQLEGLVIPSAPTQPAKADGESTPAPAAQPSWEAYVAVKGQGAPPGELAELTAGPPAPRTIEATKATARREPARQPLDF